MKCPACGGAKVFCATCWRPMGEGDCERCEPGDPCRTCDGSGQLPDAQTTLQELEETTVHAADCE